MFVSHTITFVKSVVGLALSPGDVAVDATVGNGLDTCFLSGAVGPGGRVHGFDIQADALEQARRRLCGEGAPDNVVLHHAGHERMAELLPPEVQGRLAVAMFNLGYLPGGDETLVTRAATTCAAVDAALSLMRTGGLVSLTMYTGHPGGRDEARAVGAHCAAIPKERARVMRCSMHNHPEAQVELLLIERLRRP